MALLHSTLLYISLPWVYFTLLYSTMALLHSYLLYIILPWLYFTLHYSTLLLITLPWLYFTLLDSRLLYRGSTLLYIILPWLYLTLQHEKRRAYDQRVREIDHGCFSSLLSIRWNGPNCQSRLQEAGLNDRNKTQPMLQPNAQLAPL